MAAQSHGGCLFPVICLQIGVGHCSAPSYWPYDIKVKAHFTVYMFITSFVQPCFGPGQGEFSSERKHFSAAIKMSTVRSRAETILIFLTKSMFDIISDVFYHKTSLISYNLIKLFALKK